MKQKRKEIIKLMILYAKPYKKRFITLFFSTLIQDIIKVLFLFMFGLVVDEITYYKDLNAFINLVGIICILVLGYLFLELLKTAAFWNTQLRYVLDLRIAIMKSVYKAKAKVLTKMKAGDIVYSVNYDSPDFMNVITDNIFESISTVCILLLSFGLLFKINFKLAIFMLITIPLIVIIGRIIGNIAEKRSVLLRDSVGNFNSWVFEMIKGIREIRIFSGEENVLKFFNMYYKELIKNNKKMLHINISVEQISKFIELILEIGLYNIGTYLIINEEISIGIFVTAITLTSLVTQNLARLSEFFVLLRSRQANLERVYDYIHLESEGNTNYRNNSNIKGNISFENVSFSYEGDKQVLKNINLTILQGEKIAIVGKSGVGKSTIASLILRLNDIDNGTIYIDNQNSLKYSYKEIRQNIGIVQQDVLIFDGTIRYNLSLGKREATEDEMLDACEKASILQFIISLPNGLDTVIGKTGMSLSGGQKQKISIARIFLKNPKVIIFDEATSALDYESEESINQAWLKLSENKTSIVIAHRLTSIVNADKVALIKDGELIAFAHHKELLASNNHYKELFYSQYIGGEVN